MIIKEACVDSAERAEKAESLGADRVELCARLDVDGLTPSLVLAQYISTKIKIPVMVMVRPREGNFHYSDNEHHEMVDTIRMLSELPIQGVVFGSLTKEGWPDINKVTELIKAAGSLETTFHKAIDESPEPIEAARQLNTTGITRILTSGGKETAEEGASIINQMQKVSSAIIIAAGKITSVNLDYIRNLMSVEEFHGKRIVGDIYST